MNTLGIWPFHPRHLPDELLSSWLYRIANAHHLKPHTFTHRAFPKHAVWNRDIDKSASYELLNLIALRTGRTFNEVHSSTLDSYSGYLYEKNVKLGHPHWITAIGVYHRTHRNYGLAYCPYCLAEDKEPYFRRIWRVGFAVVCLKHKVKLHNACPACKSPICFYRNDFKEKYDTTARTMNFCYNCDFNLAQSPVVLESDSVFLSFLSQLKTTLSKGYMVIDDSTIYSHLFFDVIYQLLKLTAFDKFGQKLRRQLESNINCFKAPERTSSTSRLTLSIEEREHCLRLIAYLLSNWPRSFIANCIKSNLTKSRLEKDMHYIPFWFQKSIDTHLNQKIYSASLQEI